MPYPRAKAIDQSPALCPASTPPPNWFDIDSYIIVLSSSRIYFRLVHSQIFSVDAFSGWFTNMLK